MKKSTNNDIGNLIQQCRQKETSLKERKGILTSIEEILNETESLEELPVKWTFLLDNVCWPMLTKNERGDSRSTAGRLIRIVGELIFHSESYPEFLIWIGTLYQSLPAKSEEGRADLVSSVSSIVAAVSQKSENEPPSAELVEQNALASLKWIVDVVPRASVAVYNQCLRSILLLSNTCPRVAESYFEPTIRTIFSNLNNFNFHTHEKNFEMLLDTVARFSGCFASRPELAEEIVRVVRPDIQNKGLGNMRELKRHMALTMAVVKMAKSDTMLQETNKIFSEIAQKCEENGGVWSSAALVTIVCDVLNELLILGKQDPNMRTKVEESMSEVLKNLDLSKQNTKEKHAFFNSLAKIVRQLPVESVIKTRVHQIVFNEQNGIFSKKNRDCRIFGFNTIYKELANLIAVLLTPTSLNHLQATYSDLRKCMLESMSALRTHSTQVPSRLDVSRWHEMRLLLFFSALQGISLAKSSLIVMMGIRPSIFEFFNDELPLTEVWLASNYPKVYHTFIVILVAHLKSHDFYIPQSDYVDRIRTDMDYGQTKREYAKKQVVALNKIIGTFGDGISKSTRLMVATWLHSLITACLEQKMAPNKFSESPEWVKLKHTVQHHSVLHWNIESIHVSLTILSQIVRWPEVPSYSMEIERDVLEKTKQAKWREATAIWEAGDCNSYVRQSVSRRYQMSQERQQRYIAQTSFGAEEFTLVTNFLLKQIVPATFKKGAYVWMDETIETVIHGCRQIQQHEKHEPLPDTFIEKWDWLINQAANYCIVNKMKTPLGKAMQTFNAIAVEINRLAKEVMTKKASTSSSSSEKKSKKKETDPDENGSNPGAPLKYSVQWLRVHLLLKFIEVLEKLMSSATNGGGSASFVLSEVPLSSRQFFSTNSQNCVVWLNRVYYPALIVAYFNGYYGLVIRFGSSALSHYARLSTTDEKMTSYGVSTASLMCLAMAMLGEPMEIVGIRRRVREEFHTDHGQPVMEALGEMAHARYESALLLLETILAMDESLSETLKIIVQMAMIDMLNRIRLPQTVKYYKQALFPTTTTSPEDVEDFRSIEMLTRFEKIPAAHHRKTVDWSVRERVAVVESSFSQPMRRPDLVEQQRELATLGALTLSVDSSCRLYADISSTSLVIANLVDRMNGVNSARNQLTDGDFFDRTEQGNEGDKLAICRKLMHWSRHMKHIRGHSSTAHGEIIRLSRKTGNRDLAHFHINSAVRGGEQLSAWMRLEIDRQRMKLARHEPIEVRVREMNDVFGSLADVFQTSCQLKTNFSMLPPGSVMQKNMLADGYLLEIARREEHMSRAGIQLAEFFRAIPDLDSVQLSPDLFPTMLWSEIQRRSDELSCGYHGIVGALLDISSEMCPSLAKSHLKLAQWSYEMAQIEHAPSATLFTVYQFGETAVENEALWKCMETTSQSQLEKLVEKVVADQNRVRAILAPNGHFLRIWEMTRTHRTKFLSITVTAYFQFIQNQMAVVTSSTPSSSTAGLPFSKKEETTLATLRILELLVKHGDVLSEHISNGLAQTDVHVWKEILPQLFARLSHPSEHIRKTLVELISRVCTAAPHAVVFQVVSGAASSSSDAVLDEEESLLQNERAQQSHDERHRFRVCCEQLEANLAQSYPSLVRDVRRFAQELERINLLNEEKWSVVLGTLEHEMEKRLAMIRAENQRTAQAGHLTNADKESIIGRKTALLTSQLFDVLDELYQQTVVEAPKTRNEQDFMRAYSEILSAAFAESRLSRVQSPEKSWAPFKSLIATFVHLKKGMQTFDTEHISPYLAALEASCVPMPGQESVDFDRVVTIAKVARQVTILPTKTRPKKLGIVGSDGRQVTFLFKGREDLHLDERVMQFLRLCNVMLAPGKGGGRRHQRSVAEYQAHHYAVIPLGPRSGLIKWVEGATPMFHIYRKWQMKEKALKQAAKKNGETVPEIERPSDMYHKLIRQVFTARNIDINTTTDRSKWPPAALEEVFTLLAEKTPDDLLSRELWMRANDAGTWWSVTRRFARSLAVMSMIGSVLGLGDRHLDNLLVDLKWGHVVHIDYNICFDKGKNLRIPETVPFRLTRNMRRALGPSEVYGTFRESCVHVLSTLRAGRQVLTMLLDAFVFDPLVDWTSHEHTSTSSGGISLALQLAVYGANWKTKARERLTETRELLQLRMNENRLLWLKNREDLAISMQRVTEYLQLERSLLGANGIYAQERVKAGLELRDAVARHQVLAKELRPLIRAVGRERSEFSEWLKFYKHEFIDPLLKGHSALKGADIDVDTCVHNFNIVIRNSEIVFITLLNMLSNPIDASTLRSQQHEFAAPPTVENAWIVKQDQQENSQAREVVRQVERRLNGWVSETSERKFSPREEADHLIGEATNDSNLALMYEGWTAWV